VNFHLDFGDSLAPFGRTGGKPQRSCTNSTPCSRRRRTGAVSVGQMSTSWEELLKV
jgi:hypothetical protein